MRSSFLFRRDRALRARIFVAFAALTMAGCDAPVVTMDDAGRDGGSIPDGTVIPDGATACTEDAQCEDDIACTEDACDPTLHFCVHRLVLSVCDDGVFCNGVEQCDLRDGCVAGSRETCNDGEVCTIDRCDEELNSCHHDVRDLDEDGDADFFCEGGSDCDDRDPTRSSMVPEICGDDIDNDCDGIADDDDMTMCGRPPHDACDDPLDISAGGSFIIDTRGATSDYVLGCVGVARQDMVLSFTLTEPQDVLIEAEGTDFFATALALRTTCIDRVSELECRTGFPGMIQRRGLPAGTYFVVVNGSTPGEIAIDVEFTDATPPPTNETCASPIDVSAGGTFRGALVDVRDDLTTTCGFGGSPDLVYTFTTTEVRDVRIGATAETGESVVWEVRPTCATTAGSLRCAYGAPASGRVHQLPAGTYFLILEGPSFAEIDFQLDVEFLAPTPPAVGDLCAAPIPLTLGTRTPGALTDMEDDLDTSCGFHYRDVVYSFTLPAASDVTVEIDGGTTFMNASVRSTCTDSAGQIRCSSGAPLRMRLRGLAAGTYFVVVEAFRSSSFNITVTSSAPSTVVRVTGNDICDTAYVVPSTGGVFAGSTVGMAADYRTASCGAMAQSPDATFRVDLTTRTRVVAATDGSVIDTVLHMHSAMCMTGAETVCDDNGGGGTTSLIDRTLDPGTYFYVVDGWGMTTSGEYVFEVQFLPAT